MPKRKPPTSAQRSASAKKAAATRKRNKMKSSKTAPGRRLAEQRKLARKKRRPTFAGDVGKAAGEATLKFLGSSKERRIKLAKERASKAAKVSGTQTKRLGAELARRRALKKILDAEEPAVRNFAKRSISKGQTPKKAIEQGRVLNNAGRIDDSGKLKKKGGEKLSQNRLKKLLRL